MASTISTTTLLIFVCLLLAVAPLLVGCAAEGGQTGDEDVLPKVPVPVGTENQDINCSEVDTPIELTSIEDVVTPGGFSASDVLRYAEGEFEERLQWNEHPEEGVWIGAPTHEITPRSDNPVMNIEIAYENGELRYFPPGVDAPNERIVCFGRLEIDVRVSIATNDGAFDERVDAVLMATNPSWASIGLLFHSEKIEPRVPTRFDTPPPIVHPLNGELEISTSYEGGETLAFVEVFLYVSELGINGLIEAWMRSSQHGGRLTGDIGMLGALCETGHYRGYGFGWPLAYDACVPGTGDSPSAEEVIAFINDTQWVGVREDETETTIALQFEYTDASACGQPGDLRSPLRLDAMLMIDGSFDNGQVNGRWPVTIKILTREDGELERIYIENFPARNLSIDELESDWGVTIPDASSADSVAMDFELQIEVESGVPSKGGELIIRAYPPSPGDRPIPDTAGEIVGRLFVEAVGKES